MSLIDCVRPCDRKQHPAAQLQQPGSAQNRERWGVVFEAISGSVFRALAVAVPAFAPVFRVPLHVADSDGLRLNPAHNIWNRENSGFAPKLRLGDKSIHLIFSIAGCI
jgi:hypothetical protein